MRTLLFVLLALAAAPLQAETAAPKVERYQAGPWEDDYGYRQAVRVGNTLYIAGCTGGGEMPAAIRTAYGKLKQTLDHYGLTFANIVKETVYTTRFEELKQHRAVRKEFYGADFPASTWIQIDRLFNPDYVIEVETIAIIPDGMPAAATAEITTLLTEFLTKNSDPAQHNRFWADDLIYTSSKAEVLTKANIIKSFADANAAKPAPAGATYTAEEIVVRPYGSTAALNFRLVAHHPDGRTTYYRNSGTFLRRNGEWQAVTWQATKEPAAETK
jgi:enamine deaminase RidA (YjgF/YER057c/UK114 family)